MVFSQDFVAGNARTLHRGNFFYMIGTAVTVSLLTIGLRHNRKECPCQWGALEFFVLFSVPLTVFYLYYYSYRPRYFMPVYALAFIVFWSSVTPWLRRQHWMSWASVAIVILVSAFFVRERISAVEKSTERYDAAVSIERDTPANAVVISALPMAYLESQANRSGKREFIPIGRGVEYASKLVTAMRVHNPSPAPRNVFDHRCPGVLAGGAEEAVDRVARDRIQDIANYLKNGRPVFLELSGLQGNMMRVVEKVLDKKFERTQIMGTLYEYHSR